MEKFQLKRKSSSAVGEIVVGLKLEKNASKDVSSQCVLHVAIQDAWNVFSALNKGLGNYYVEVILLPDKISKRSRVIEKEEDLTWNEIFRYTNVDSNQASNTYAIEIKLMEETVSLDDKLVGGLRIGPYPDPPITPEYLDSTVEEARHWRRMIACPNKWTTFLHTLRISMINRLIKNPKQSQFSSDPRVQAVTSISYPLPLTQYGQLVLSLQFSELNIKADGVYGNVMVHLTSTKELHENTSQNYKYKIVTSFFYFTETDLEKIQACKNFDLVEGDIATFENVLVQKPKTKVALELSVVEGVGNHCVGGLHIGPFPDHCTDNSVIEPTLLERAHWELAIVHPDEWVLCCHTLRHSMELEVMKSKLLKRRKSFAIKKDSVGQLLISVQFDITENKSNSVKGDLYVKINAAQDLKCSIKNGVLIQCNIFPHTVKDLINFKTDIIKGTRNPIWNQLFVFRDIYQDAYRKKRVLDISLWDNNDGSNFAYIGRLCLGPDPHNCRIDEILHWESIFSHAGKWVDATHTLKP